ncbi:RHS repeat-associated core domain-containing protein [Streptomyces griseomycini]|uniref:RHS repeat-associated core domain-containing protein n=1 Tax=Streptomyces griseomycini TaxID=66895 RepID=UPI0035713EE6
MRQPLPDVRHEPVVRGRFVIAQPRHDDQMGAALGVAFCGVSPPLRSSTGTLYQRWAYNPFGTRVLGTVTGGAPASPPSCTGARYETTTGDPDLHARQYDTTTGRFTRPDPATRAQTTPYISPYAYADNAPTLLTDPSGLTPDDPNDGESEVRRTRFPVVTSPTRPDRGSAPSRQAADSDEGDLLGQSFGGFGVQFVSWLRTEARQGCSPAEPRSVTGAVTRLSPTTPTSPDRHALTRYNAPTTD